jgi:hypothetical protein
MPNTLSRILVAFVCVSLAAVWVVADTIKLKNGSVIKGKVITFNDREFTVSLDMGTSSKRTTSRLVLAVDDVESIQFDGSDAPVASFSNSPDPSKDAASKEAPKTVVIAPTFTNTPPPNATQSTPPPDAPLADKTVSVVAAADWTSSEIRVKKGQRITISASGQIDLGSGRRTGPEGTSLADPKKLIANTPTGALIAVIGDDNDDFITVGPQSSFVADRDGILFLSVNEANLRDNGGSFVARIRVLTK